MNQKLLILNLFLASALIVVAIAAFKGNDGGKNSDSPEQRVRSINLDKDFDFCGEKLPMDNWDVKQRLDAELLRNVYFHSQTIIALKRANALFPIIEPILREEGVPDDLKYLAVAESTLSNAISPSGAKGVWQFMKSAADDYKLEVNTEVDERYHLEKATHAACKYLRSQKSQLGSWTAAAAAYNGGPGRIREEMDKQRTKSFYNLNLAADETMRYPFRIVAIKEVMKYASEYDYDIDKEHLYPPLTDYKTVDVKGAIPSLGDFAVQNGTTYRMLKLYNPWLVDSKLTNKEGKTYQIRIPK